jgi:DNA-binding NarL/FixJ family response regulator
MELSSKAASTIQFAAKQKGIYKGWRKGTTKADPTRAKQLRAKGLTVAEIAQALGTNKRTVQRYLKAATDKVVAKSEIEELG